MKCGGLFTTHVVKIDWDFNRPLTLSPFGDVHYMAPLHCSSEWKRYCDEHKKKKDIVYLGMGDYMDLVSTSERAALRIGKGGIHESTMETIEDMYKNVTDQFLDTIGFMKGKCIGLIEGNHHGNFRNGTTTTMRMCEKLSTKYLGVISVIRLQFIIHGTTRLSVDICAHHGKGGGQLVGTPFNQLGKMQDLAEADIYLMGHDHNRGCVTGQRLVPTFDSRNNKLTIKERKIIYGRTGSFLRGYVDNKVSYIADAAMKPANLGWIEIELTPRSQREDGVQRNWVEIKGIS